MDNQKFITKVSQASGKISLIEELKEDDTDRRLQFCQEFSEKLTNNQIYYTIHICRKYFHVNW